MRSKKAMKPKRYKSVDSMVKDISGKKFYRHFQKSQVYARKMVEAREAVIRAAKNWVNGNDDLIPLYDAVIELKKLE